MHHRCGIWRPGLAVVRAYGEICTELLKGLQAIKKGIEKVRPAREARRTLPRTSQCTVHCWRVHPVLRRGTQRAGAACSPKTRWAISTGCSRVSTRPGAHPAPLSSAVQALRPRGCGCTQRSEGHDPHGAVGAARGGAGHVQEGTTATRDRARRSHSFAPPLNSRRT
jgi:hypothetical protein